MHRLALLCAWASLARALDTRVVVLSNNDLDPATPRASALYLDGALTCAEAQTACGELREALLGRSGNGTWLGEASSVHTGNGTWVGEARSIHPGNGTWVGEALTAERHGAGVGAGQGIWVAGDGHGACSVFSPGNASTVSKPDAQRLPALCTNSAPLSQRNTTAQDTSRQINLTTSTAGVLTGFRDKFAWKFLGVKFAQAQRFQAPVPLVVANDTRREALGYGPMCAQLPDPDNGHLLYTEEDCLQLNVFTPVVDLRTDRSTAPKLPVMVFIHGGGLNTGDSGPFPYNTTTSGFVGASVSNVYDGTNLVSYGGAVLVTINYRLTALGWFNASNAALKDTLLALEWVQENVEAFGGDPERVLLFGESAGGIMIRYLLAANTKYTGPAAALIHLAGAAILESDFPQLDIFTPSAYALNTSLTLAKAIGCADNSTTTFSNAIAECVQTAPAGDIVMASFNLGLNWNVVIDGDYVPTDIVSAVTHGTSSKVPTIYTSNQCEYCYFIPAAIASAPASLYPQLLPSLLLNSTQVDAILNATDLYPYQTAPPSGGLSGSTFTLAQLATDFAVHCPMAYLSSLENQNNGTGIAPRIKWCSQPASVCHGDELYWVFATTEIDNLYQPLSEDQLRVTRDVIDRWTAFARTGNPNYEGASLEWPTYDGDNEVVIGLNTSIQAYRSAQCEFLRTRRVYSRRGLSRVWTIFPVDGRDRTLYCGVQPALYTANRECYPLSAGPSAISW
ncbi:alpha/beta-hydrolase [Gloeophyllum trabeum ATCC 11539]|uniref:Alpha/beta-hydrolase n=1 Tax=Gloeophyllum trabeum (strain ATCC 11539 / FP-39264 / Madison 617) TaxID=670483 RepID=S7PUF0_GLOTA|nr:alpha/beta-hydrolase [Gloeophyllum trabeum ATCC 11539]EPQ50983.1 alpha/beta-hydrolase [Gloeophyllum trabeum ATCC 11539]